MEFGFCQKIQQYDVFVSIKLSLDVETMSSLFCVILVAISWAVLNLNGGALEAQSDRG